MFVSMPDSAFVVPIGMGPKNAKYWRMLSLTTGAAWFVLSVRGSADRGLLTTFLLVWDDDVIELLERKEWIVESLQGMIPGRRGADRGLSCIQIREIWRARQADSDAEDCVVFIDAAGTHRSGVFLDPVSEVVGAELVAKVSAP